MRSFNAAGRIASKDTYCFGRLHHHKLRDLRAKAATDLPDLAHARRSLGHKRRSMTEHYAGRRKGILVEPVESPQVDKEVE